ncbi:MAG: YHS domain protein [Bacteroidetes bacterium]|nr:MAG: YHS domain protein [Bacteroidota bacterium]TAG92191.1 MAG: YHS domain protein [Bacteroidota bacterium]
MKKISFILLFLSLNFVAFGQNRANHFNVSKRIAIYGYDPVAYFTEKKAVKGKKEFAVNADNVVYYCSSAKNQDLLIKNYKKYEPQYGGWCAYAMGKSAEKVEIDPSTFKIIDGKLYLFYNAYFTNTLTSWNKDETNLKNKADKNWGKIFK